MLNVQTATGTETHSGNKNTRKTHAHCARTHTYLRKVLEGPVHVEIERADLQHLAGRGRRAPRAHERARRLGELGEHVEPQQHLVVDTGRVRDAANLVEKGLWVGVRV